MTIGTIADTCVRTIPLTYRGYVYDTETTLYYLQFRYYDPELGRFINADALLSAGQGIIGYNIYTYCLNNPVRYKDASGVAAEEATDVEDDQDDKEPGTRVVGAGIQVDFDYSLSTGGFEIIMYWDSTVCGEGNWKVAVYGYNGVCINMDDPIIESVIACMMANADLLSMEDNAPSTAFIQAVMLAIPTDLSIGLSGVVVIGNNKFDNTEAYTGEFTSVNVSWNRVRGSYAYADACEAFTLGFNVKGRPIIPSRTISQTFYYCVGEITFAAPF